MQVSTFATVLTFPVPGRSQVFDPATLPTTITTPAPPNGSPLVVIPFAARAPATATRPALLAASPATRRHVEIDTACRGATAAIARKDWGTAFVDAQAALDLLEAPLDKTAHAPAYRTIPHGFSIYREMVFQAAAFAEPPDTLAVLTRLHRVTEEMATWAEEHEGEHQIHRARAALLRAHALMRYTAATPIQRVERYDAALMEVDAIRHSDTFAARPDLELAADLLAFELLARQAERAHHRGDLQQRRHFLDQLDREVAHLLYRGSRRELRKTFGFAARSGKAAACPPQQAKPVGPPPSRYASAEGGPVLWRAPCSLDRCPPEMESMHETIATYISHYATLLARMQLWGAALRVGRQVTTHPVLADAAASKQLLDDPLFTPFVEEGRFLAPEALQARAPRLRRFLQRVQAALMTAHSEGFGQTALWGLGGLAAATAVTAAQLSNGGIVAVLIPAVAAATAAAVNRFRNGWGTAEAVDAWHTGLFARSVGETSRDAANMVVRGGIETACWLVPTAVAAEAQEGVALVGDTLSRATELYGKFGAWISNGVASLFDGNIFSHLGDTAASMFRGDPAAVAGRVIYNMYTIGAGAQYVGFLLVPSFRPLLRKTALWFVPGAVMLGADLGMAIAGTHDYGDRIGRGLISTAEGLSMLFAAGVIALAQKGSIAAATRSMWEGFRKSDHNALVAIALTVGVSSALGGQMQRGTRPDNIVLLGLQGAAITVGLLPIVLGISGIMKRNIELAQGVREGWQDAQGLAIGRRALEAIAGGLASFNTPYAHNRVLRAPTLDVASAGVRTGLGWDTNLGYGVFAGINCVATNPTATMTWPETGGVDWEREAFHAMLRECSPDRGPAARAKGRQRLRDHLTKAGQRMPLAHMALPHTTADRLFPLVALRRIVRPPQFPLQPQDHYFSSLFQLLTPGGYYNSLRSEELDILLEEVAAFAADAARIDTNPENLSSAHSAREGGTQQALPVGGATRAPVIDTAAVAAQLVALDTVRPVLQTLWMAREGTEIGPNIQRFFAAHPWLFDIAAIAPPEFQAVTGRSRRQRRAAVRRHIAMPSARYTEHVREHAHRATPSLMAGLFEQRR